MFINNSKDTILIISQVLIFKIANKIYYSKINQANFNNKFSVNKSFKTLNYQLKLKLINYI